MLPLSYDHIPFLHHTTPMPWRLFNRFLSKRTTAPDAQNFVLGPFVGPLQPTRTISLAADFSPTPAGIVDEDGPHNAARFRTEHLVPALQSAGPTVLELEGLAVCAPSFLEAAFAPLVTEHEFTADYLHQYLKVRPDQAHRHDDTAALAFHYIDRASPPKTSSQANS